MKSDAVFKAAPFPLQPNIAHKFAKNVAGPTQDLAAGQTVCLFGPTQLTILTLTGW